MRTGRERMREIHEVINYKDVVGFAIFHGNHTAEDDVYTQIMNERVTSSRKKERPRR